MIILISGSSHTGKTLLAQRLLEQFRFPYLSIDHLKMGLIRSGQTSLTPLDDEALVPYLWNIIKEIIKTAIENKQNLIVEGCYIPFDWQKDFAEEYLQNIRYICLVMTKEYINSHFDDIINNANAIEQRLCDDITKDELLKSNAKNLENCKSYGYNHIEIDDSYDIDCFVDTIKRIIL